MIIINVKEGESIDRALKRYKQKHRNIGLVNQMRKKQHFTKKSALRRAELLKAEYKLQKSRSMGN